MYICAQPPHLIVGLDSCCEAGVRKAALGGLEGAECSSARNLLGGFLSDNTSYPSDVFKMSTSYSNY